MSTGAAYCMLTDRLFPGSIQLNRVKWNVKSDLDSIANWKIVQNAWHDLGITKVSDLLFDLTQCLNLANSSPNFIEG